MGSFEHSRGFQHAGQFFGFALSYAIFTTILFWVFKLRGSSAGLGSIILLTLGITAIGFLLRRWLR